jgi:hypothetical protein
MSAQKRHQNQQKSQVGNRKAGSRSSNNQQPLSRKNFEKLPKGERQKLMSAPVAVSRSIHSYAPKERSQNGRRTIIYKEYVQDIPGSVAFATTQYPVNPGLNNLFAWLAGQALFYQEYTVKRLRFCYETEKATTLSGKVMFCFLQDSSDPAPASKQEMLENQMKAAGAIWQPFCLDVNMKNFPALGRSRFVRSGNLAANLDVKTYDIGQWVIATQGMADTSNAGEIYIEYELELRTPIQSAQQLAVALSALVAGGGAVTNAAFFGTAPVITGGLAVTAAGNTLTFNTVGQFLVSASLAGTSLNTLFNPSFAGSTSNASLKTGISNAAANVGTQAEFIANVIVTARGQTLVIDTSGASATVTTTATRVAVYANING